jgi:hypothetical protein
MAGFGVTRRSHKMPERLKLVGIGHSYDEFSHLPPVLPVGKDLGQSKKLSFGVSQIAALL